MTRKVPTKQKVTTRELQNIAITTQGLVSCDRSVMRILSSIIVSFYIPSHPLKHEQIRETSGQRI